MDKDNQEFLIAFGKSLRKYREKAGLSQESLASRARLHRTYIGSVERGERNISLTNIRKISSALGCTPHELLRSFNDNR